MNRRQLLRKIGLAAGALALTGCGNTFSSGPSLKKPNIVLIMADDIGYECFGCYGSNQYKTPNIDALASMGVKFTHCYAQPLCTPSRVKLMTGKSNIRNYVDFSVMDKSEITFAHMLKDSGYKTCVAGKWQLYGAEHYPEHVRGTGVLPEEAGFDTWCLWQVDKLGGRYWKPSLNINGTHKQFAADRYGPDVCTDFIIDFITGNKDEPFLAYYPMILVHDPFDPTPDSKDRSSKNKQNNFSDMVAYMDKLVGRIVDTLREHALLDNTLIMFVGDNGTNRKITSTLGDEVVKGAKGRPTDAGTRVPFVAAYQSAASGAVCDDLVDLSDFLPTIAQAADVKVHPEAVIDGISFLPQLMGKKSSPRDAVFMYYNPRPLTWPEQECRFARDKRWKLYGDGKLYDVSNDVLEKNPIPAGQGNKQADQARKKLQALIKSMPEKPIKIKTKR